MNFIIVFGMLCCLSLCSSLCILTVSNALDMSSAVIIVLCGGLFLLSPVVMMLCNAVVVECCFLKPCCVGLCVMLLVMYGRMIFSSVLASGDRRAMGL